MKGTFVLVGCGKQKRDTDEPVEVRDLYTSTYSGLKRRYAEAATQWAREASHQRNAWAILSAEHGILLPRIEVEPYETTVEDLDAPAPEHRRNRNRPDGEPVETLIDLWAKRVASGLESWLNWPFRSDNDPRESPCKRLIVLAGGRYVAPLEARGAFRGNARHSMGYGLPAKPEFPFRTEDLNGIGEQMAWLKQEAERLETEATPAERSELAAFGGGYDRDRALWQVDRPEIDIEATEQASLNQFEDVDGQFIATKQQGFDDLVCADGGAQEASEKQ